MPKLVLARALPKGAEYLADVVADVGAPEKVSPYLLLGFAFAESNYGLALKPAGPEGSGDFIARPCTPDRDARMKTNPLPGVVRKTVDGIKARKIVGPVDAWVPTHTGWGCGIMQFDYEAHFEFCKGGAWKDPAKIMRQAALLIKGNMAFLKKSHPALAERALWEAVVAAYNAGAGRVSKFIKEGKSVDSATFHPGYVAKILSKAEELAGAKGAYVAS